MSIKNSTIDSDLKNEEPVKFEAETTCKSKEWSSFLCVLALAGVIKRKNVSHFPDCGDEMQRVLRNQVMCPRAECLSEVPLHVLFCELGGQRLHEKRFFHVDHFVPLIQFYNQSRKRKRGLQHLQTKTKKSKIDVKRMFNSTFKNQALVLNSQLVKILQVFLQNAPSSIFKTEL